MRVIVIAATVMTILQCSSNIPTIAFLENSSNQFAKVDTVSTRIAVFPLLCRGTGLSRGVGYLAADQITVHLFREKNMQVVERSLVNAALEKHRVENPNRISVQELRTVSQELHANIIVLGTIDCFNSRNGNSRDEKLVLTLRYLDAKLATVLHLEQTTVSGDLQSSELIAEAISKSIQAL